MNVRSAFERYRLIGRLPHQFEEWGDIIKRMTDEYCLFMSNWSYNAGNLVLWVLIIIVGFCWFKFPKKEDELIVAASHNDTNAIVRILGSGVSVDYATKPEKKTALMVASAKGGRETVVKGS